MNSNLHTQLEQAINEGNYQNSLYILNQIMNSDGKVIIHAKQNIGLYNSYQQTMPLNYNQTFSNASYSQNYDQTINTQANLLYPNHSNYPQANPLYPNPPAYSQPNTAYSNQTFYSQANTPYPNQTFYQTGYPHSTYQTYPFK